MYNVCVCMFVCVRVFVFVCLCVCVCVCVCANFFFSLQVFHLIEAIELITRRYLSVRSLPVDNVDLKKRISDAVISSNAVQTYWKAIAGSIPKKFEQYSVCLLQAITELWVNVRGHSFAQGWTMMFETKYKTGTRKTLQAQRGK